MRAVGESEWTGRELKMDNPRPGKVAVVEEVRGRLDAASATVLTEYRGLSVSEMAALRRALLAAGADYKIYKNTLVRLAVAGGRHEALDQLLLGPTAIAFVSGEISAVAKVLREYARTNPSLVVKGGLHAEGFLTAQDLGALADLPSRDVLLARFAGGLAASLRQFAGLLEALPRNLAYGLSALLDQRGGPPADEAATGTSEAPSPEDATSTGSEAAPEASADAGTETGAEAAVETGAEAAVETGAEAAVETGADNTVVAAAGPTESADDTEDARETEQ
ncbi:MAG: 50S ribosomal protein L10 [Acidimicrobiales bacterium]